MSLFEWTDDYSLGIREIDDQHRKLLDIINELHGAIRAGLGREALSGVLDDMVRYAYSHFSTEEHYMERYEYPGQEAHVKEHQTFLEETEAIQDRLSGREQVLSLEVLVFLKDWLTRHILVIDRQYVSHFKSRGLQ